jgi:hypothetical protein
LLNWGYIVTFTKVLTILSQLNSFTPFIILPYFSFSLPPFLEQVSFFYFHTWVHNIFTIFTHLHPFLISSPSHCTNPHPQALFCLPVLCFERRHFCLFKIATQGVSLWHSHVYTGLLFLQCSGYCTDGQGKHGSLTSAGSPCRLTNMNVNKFQREVISQQAESTNLEYWPGLVL